MRSAFPSRWLLFLVLGSSASFGAFAKFPYLQNLTDSSIVVRWESRAAQDGKVEYGLTASYGSAVSHSDSTIDHDLTLTGLSTDTVYHYRVVSGPDTSLDYTFRARVSGDRPFRFFAYGDNRSDHAAHQAVVSRMFAQSPLPGIAVSAGDLTDDGSLPLFGIFFNIERSLLNRLPVYPALGNHDADSAANWLRFFALPNNERWYTFRYGNSAFHCLDNYSAYDPGSAQYDWLVSELEADSADPAVRHSFVFFHEPPYTTSANHSSNLTVRQYLCPLFEQFHVAIVFCGHVHSYEHALVNGVHYITTGGGGAPLHAGWDPPEPWDIYREATLEFVLVDVSGDTIRTRGVRPDGSEFDPLQLPAGVEEAPRLRARSSGSGATLSRVASPTTGRIQCSFTLAEPGEVSLSLFDPAGRKAAAIARAHFAAGEHRVSWAGARLPAGTYFVVLRSAGRAAFARTVVLGPE